MNLQNPIIITQEIVVNKDCLSVLEEIELTRPDFKVIHKGAVGQFHKPPPEDVDPVKVLRQYIESKSLRIWDFFKQYDKDKSMSVSTEEFRKGIMVRPKSSCLLVLTQRCQSVKLKKTESGQEN